MNNNKSWVGMKVKFVEVWLHETMPLYNPPVDTFGIVLKEDEDKILVQWDRGTTSKNDVWWCFKWNVEVMLETTDENVLRYGLVITDDAFGKTVTEFGHRNAIRVRLISYCDKLYYHKMIDGEVVDFKVVGKTNA